MMKRLTNKQVNNLERIMIYVLTMIVTIAMICYTEAEDNKTKAVEYTKTMEIFESFKPINSISSKKNLEEVIVDVEDKEIIYIVEAGDYLYKICEKLYDNGSYCYALAEYNGLDPYKDIYVGQEIKIPNIDDEQFMKAQKIIEEKQKEEKARKEREQASRETLPSRSKAPEYSTSVKNNPGEVNTSGYEYLGKYRITGYTPGCAHCCGNTAGITASGVKAVVGRTIAAKNLPFGTTLYIKGYGYYVVEDRGGFAEGTIDVASPSHEVSRQITVTTRSVDVYIVPNN